MRDRAIIVKNTKNQRENGRKVILNGNYPKDYNKLFTRYSKGSGINNFRGEIRSFMMVTALETNGRRITLLKSH